MIVNRSTIDARSFAKKGLQHYELLGKLFNANTATSLLHISSA